MFWTKNSLSEFVSSQIWREQENFGGNKIGQKFFGFEFITINTRCLKLYQIFTTDTCLDLLNTLESDFSPVQHIDQTPWGSYQQMAAFSEFTSLVAEISSAIHHAWAYVRSVRKLK